MDTQTQLKYPFSPSLNTSVQQIFISACSGPSPVSVRGSTEALPETGAGSLLLGWEFQETQMGD